MVDASASNAGDRYHFVYVARRMLDMLHPRSNLQLIQMENISSEDQHLAESPDDLLGVDLTEYYGGDSFESASKTVIIQVKYSPTHPNSTWTLSRLGQNKTSSKGREKAGTSVLRKLANAFEVAYGKIDEECRSKLQVRLLSNQRLNENLENQISEVQGMLNDYDEDDLRSGRYLENEVLGKIALVQDLQKVTSLTWKRLSAFLRCWDISAFGQPMAMEQEVEFANLLDQFVNAGMHFGNLINFVEEHAIPNRPATITKEQIYGLLRIKETNFFPAPTRFTPVDNLLITKNVQNVANAIDQSEHNVVLVHGLSGTGKSTSLQVLQKEYADEKAVILYDGYGSGEGLSTGRFPLRKFFVQIINELDHLFRTNILATTHLDDDEVLRRFESAIKKASQLANNAEKKLVIAVDALDDIAEAAEDHPNKRHESFLPYLWRISWPDNCVLLVSARTENLSLFTIPPDHVTVKIEGFTENETVKYLQYFWPEATDELLHHTHKRTKGNPRVLSKLIEMAQREPPDDLLEFVDEQAQETAFKYYKEQIPKCLELEEDRLVLAVLREARQFISLHTLSDITERRIEEVQNIVGQLCFGLEITPANEISWADKDFVNFARRFAPELTEKARHQLADYCRDYFDQNDYAFQNISYHFFQAGMYQSLIDWWMTDKRLMTRTLKAKPHTEDILTDLEYSLRAAVKIKDFKTALILLLIAAEIVQGVDIFNEVAQQHLQAVVECNYFPRMISYLDNRESDESKASTYLALAKVLALLEKDIDVAKNLIERTFTINEKLKHEAQSGIGFSDQMVLDVGLYEACVAGLDKSLHRMKRWDPPEAVIPLYTDLIRDWCSHTGRSQETLEIIEQSELEDQRRAYSLLGILTSPTCNLDEVTYQLVAEELLTYLDSDIIHFAAKRPSLSDHKNTITVVIENTLFNYRLKDLVERFLIHWPISEIESFRTSNMPEFLRRKAIEEVLGLSTFDPNAFIWTSGSGENASEYQEHQREEELTHTRYRMQFLFPPLLAITKAKLGEAEEVILAGISDYLKQWGNKERPYWYPSYEYLTDAILITKNLLEAVVALPNYNSSLVDKIIGLADKIITNNHYTRYAAILSSDERYYAKAERLVEQQMEVIKPPQYRAGEAVDALLELYPIAARFNPAFAQRIFIQARIEASGWDRRVDGLAFALLSTLEYSESIEDPTNEELFQLLSVFEFIKRVAEGEKVNTHIDWFIQSLAHIQPSFAFQVIQQSSKTEFLELESIIDALALGLLETRKIPAQLIYPLTHIADSDSKAITIFEHSIAQLQNSPDGLDKALDKSSKYICVDVGRNSRVQASQEFVQWATEQGLVNHPSVLELKAFSESLASLLRTKSNQPKNSYEYEYLNDDAHQTEQLDLILQFEEALLTSPIAALEILQKASDEEIEKIHYESMQYVVGEMLEHLSSAHLPDLLAILERYAEVRRDPRIFSLLGRVANRGLVSESLKDTYVSTLNRLLTDRNLRYLTHWHYQSHLVNLLGYKLPDNATMLETVLTAAINNLSDLYAGNLYHLTGMLSRLLLPTEARPIFKMLLDRSIDKLQEPSQFVVDYDSFNEPVSDFLIFLINYLGHPELAKRWKALYTLIDIALDAPDDTLPLLVNELSDSAHERWMTKRVWILFLFHHLSLRQPAELASYKKVFLHQALNKQFPHAKIRYHAQQILFNIEQSLPGSLSENELEKVQNVNQPVAYIKVSDADPYQPYDGVRWSQRENVQFRFDLMDTLPYWYAPLGHVFAAHRCDVADVAYRWIVERWGFNDNQVHWKTDWVHKHYSSEDIHHDHGSLPSVESLKTYVERHGMFMAAGKMVDSLPVLISRGDGDKWSDWTRYHLREADPLLTSRYRSTPPLQADNYGIFSKGFEEWSAKDIEEEYEQELWVDNTKNWMIVFSYRSGSFKEREFSVRVRSFLVAPETSKTIARLVNSQEDFLVFPYWEAPYDSIIQEIENDLLELWKQNKDDPRFKEEEMSKKPFELRGWIFHWGQEMPLHEYDPKWPNIHRNLDLFTPNFCSQREIRFDPISLEWQKCNGEKVAYNEVWQDIDRRGYSLSAVEGHRLVIRFDFLLDYLRTIKMDLIFTVRLSRSRPYDRGYKENQYDHGTTRAFILKSDGTLEIAMEQSLIEKGKELLQELDHPRASTLQKWMAHYIVELMERSASSDMQEAQTAKQECAEVITKLWQQITEDKVVDLRRKLWDKKFAPDNEDDNQILSDALTKPDYLDSLNSELRIELLASATDIENWLFRILRLSQASNISEEEWDGVLPIFFELERGEELIEKLTNIFPGFRGLELADIEAIEQQTELALHQIYQLRFVLLLT